MSRLTRPTRDMLARIVLRGGVPMWSLAGREFPVLAGGATDNVISRTDAAALIPEDVASEVIKGVTEQSAALRFFRSVTMSTAQRRLPVVSALPVAGFVSGDTGLKQTTEVNWANKYLDAEEIAVIVPVPDAVLDDVNFDIWAEIRPELEAAFASTLDAAIFFGTDKPASWPTAVVPAAVAAGNVIARGANLPADGGISADIDEVIGKVEADGFDVSAFVAARAFRGQLRKARDTTGQRLLDVTAESVEGQPVAYAMAGKWPTGLSAAELIAGDFGQGIVGRRQDITYKILTEGVIQNADGTIQFNLAQQDMVALRAVARYAWQVPNPINRENPDAGTRYPFAVLRSPAA
jgi:HK97 family phage major capsid protein